MRTVDSLMKLWLNPLRHDWHARIHPILRTKHSELRRGRIHMLHVFHVKNRGFFSFNDHANQLVITVRGMEKYLFICRDIWLGGVIEG